MSSEVEFTHKSPGRLGWLLAAMALIACVPRADIVSDKPQTVGDARPFQRSIYPVGDTVNVAGDANGIALQQNNPKPVTPTKNEKPLTSPLPPDSTNTTTAQVPGPLVQP